MADEAQTQPTVEEIIIEGNEKPSQTNTPFVKKQVCPSYNKSSSYIEGWRK